jgi:hypothetical protein
LSSLTHTHGATLQWGEDEEVDVDEVVKQLDIVEVVKQVDVDEVVE